MDAFWCITLGFIILHFMYRRGRPTIKKTQPEPVAFVGMSEAELDELDASAETNRLENEKQARKQKDIADLKKQGYTDELITVILPTLHNDGQ